MEGLKKVFIYLPDVKPADRLIQQELCSVRNQYLMEIKNRLSGGNRNTWNKLSIEDLRKKGLVVEK